MRVTKILERLIRSHDLLESISGGIDHFGRQILASVSVRMILSDEFSISRFYFLPPGWPICKSQFAEKNRPICLGA
jgi:hypothetical protein